MIGGGSIRWSPYIYAGANPINYLDPSGELFGEIAIGISVLAIVAVVISVALLIPKIIQAAPIVYKCVKLVPPLLQYIAQNYPRYQHKGVTVEGPTKPEVTGVPLNQPTIGDGLESVPLYSPAIRNLLAIFQLYDGQFDLGILTYDKKPKWKDITIDWIHLEKHHRWSGPVARQRREAYEKGLTTSQDGWDVWNDEMSNTVIEKIIKEIYNNGDILSRQIDLGDGGTNILIRGTTSAIKAAKYVEVWVNTAKNLIKTAYPSFPKEGDYSKSIENNRP